MLNVKLIKCGWVLDSDWSDLTLLPATSRNYNFISIALVLEVYVYDQLVVPGSSNHLVTYIQ